MELSDLFTDTDSIRSLIISRILDCTDLFEILCFGAYLASTAPGGLINFTDRIEVSVHKLVCQSSASTSTLPLLLLFFALCAPFANAARWESRDWKNSEDGLLTYDAILNLEILDVSLTSTGHQAVKDQVALGEAGAYPGFRFMTSDEMCEIMLGLVNICSDVTPTSEQALSIDLFLGLIGRLDFSNYDFNTCDFAEGCEFYPDSDFSALVGGHRHILTTNRVFWQDDVDAAAQQLLVREVPIPGALTLFGVGLATFGMVRRREPEPPRQRVCGDLLSIAEGRGDPRRGERDFIPTHAHSAALNSAVAPA